MQRESTEARKAKRVAQSKQGKHINVAQSGERYVSSTPTPWGCISQMVTPNQSLGGMDATTQAQAYGGRKAWKSLDLERLTWG